ncbi:protein kinase STUNTED-like isoform X2 [Amaranthus tricolor]|uniref:protein kinase STUNTED-like isoform X2 n=1 Tax=Amaranthus tricolor TaxID=29722 RepID=UPI002584B943|nr:protein kinase STUNTED-like isoform X2 [Amaranthus tricolor]
MTILKEVLGHDQTHQRRKILVSIRFDSESKELLGWAIVKVAEACDHVIALHICRNFDDESKEKVLLDDYLEIYKGLCDIKKVKLSGKILPGNSIRKSIVEEGIDSAATTVIVGISKPCSIRGRLSTAKYCAKHLPSTTGIFTVHNGKVVFQRLSNDHSPGIQKDQRLSFRKLEFHDSEASKMDSESGSTDSSSIEFLETQNKYTSIETKKEANSLKTSSSFSNTESITEQKPGWPLLRRSSLPTQKALDSRKMSVVQWVMSFPDRSPPGTPQSIRSNYGDSDSSNGSNGVFSRKSRNSLLGEMDLEDQESGIPFELSFLDFTWFSYEVLRNATSSFSSENIIGKGGCSRVYKGIFLDGKKVAVKVLKSSKQTWKDFSLEVNIMSSLRHKNITPLLGVCVDNSELISVYEFMSKGSLEDNLHVENKEKKGLSWSARLKVAIGIAEALVYLHHRCTKPVIHRDIKTSNILLSDNFEPRLSDFGLAIWGPNSSCYETYTDVVGTFGYLAPEYFMYGKITHKAKPMLQSGKIIKRIIDPCLKGSVDESQMQRMILAATLCLTRATRLRPNMDRILKLLKGEESIETWAEFGVYDEKQEDQEENSAEFYQNSSADKSHLSLALLDIEEDFTSYSSGERSTSSHTLGDFLSTRCRSSCNFD